MDKYVLIKYQLGEDSINSCQISGMTLEEICYILDAPSELILTYNDTDKFFRVNNDEFAKYTQNRRDYYTIVCSDINCKYTSKQLTKEDINDLLHFSDYYPQLFLPSISDRFCIYSHDETLNTYMCFKMEFAIFVNKFLNWLISPLSNGNEKCFEQNDFECFSNAIQRGIFIDTENNRIINDDIYISSGFFEPHTDFGDNIFVKDFPEFKFIRVRTV